MRNCLILLIFFIISCGDEIDDRPEETGGSNVATHGLILEGRVETNAWGATAFRIQLTKDGNNNHSSQVFVTQRNNYYEFKNLEEGKYILYVTKNGYEPETDTLYMKKEKQVLLKNITMLKNGSEGFTGKMQILDENGEDVSVVEFTRNTCSIFFYLFNGTGVGKEWRMVCIPDEWFIGGFYIVNGKSTLLESGWTKEIKPSSGYLKPNEIVLLEVVIDPLLYTLREHSSSTIYIDYNLNLRLSY